MLIDTHSHLFSEQYNGEIEEVIARAKESGVGRVLMPNVDSSSVRRLFHLADLYPDFCFPMMGIHPTSVKEDYREELEVFDYWVSKRKLVGIGEIGIDLYWDKAWIEEQKIVFTHQLRVAKEKMLPVSVHVRESYNETIEIVKREKNEKLFGVFHAFSGDLEQAKEVLSLGFKIGVSGVLTFKNSGIDQLLSSLSPYDIVLETDSPWLSPAPYRGKRNESGYITLIRKKAAEIFNCSEEEIEKITTENAMKIFPV